MKKLILFGISAMFLLGSCVSNKEFSALEAKQKETQDLLNTATVKLNSCLSDKAVADTRVEGLQEQLTDMRRTAKDFSKLSTQGASNLETTLESLREKDVTITRLQDALTYKDSVTLAIVSSLKKEVGMDDPDIEINVEKGVVFISIADKLLFKSGSYTVTNEAKGVLAKVAKVVNSKPEFECMVESHTDDKSYNKGVLVDNWDLSVKRATSVVRVLEELKVNPQQLIAAGRSSYMPLVPNDTAEHRAMNRRTKIIVLPKIDQFYKMIEDEMKELSEEEN